MITIQSAKANFFDRETVIRAANRDTLRALSRLGAYIRTRAKTSIRKKRGVSAPGSPPHSHTGLLRKFILFSYDQASNSVVVGPTLLNGVGTGEAPSLLEYGGAVLASRKSRHPKRLAYRPRPFMRPAMAAELQRLPDHFRQPLLTSGV